MQGICHVYKADINSYSCSSLFKKAFMNNGKSFLNRIYFTNIVFSLTNFVKKHPLTNNLWNKIILKKIVTFPPKTRTFSKRVQFAIDDKKEKRNERQTVQRSINNQNFKRERVGFKVKGLCRQ